MMTLILTAYTDEYSRLGAITAPRWKSYADRYGHRFHVARDFPADRHPCMHKLWHIMEWLPQTDMLFYVGADTLCTNPRMPLPVSLGRYEMAASLDWWPDARYVSTDALLIRNTPLMLALFKAASETTPYVSAGGYDLVALGTTFDANPKYREKLIVLPRRRFQAVPVECGFPNAICPLSIVVPWMPGDFIMHVTGIPLDKRLSILKRYAK